MDMKKSFKVQVSIILPVYGSENTLNELTSQINTVMSANKYSHEIICVCDQSPDKSWKVIKGLTKKYKNLKGILLRVNAGQHNALMAGLSESKGRYVITMDDDLQHAPSDIIQMINELQKGYDVVYANFEKRNHSLWKVFGSRLNNLFASYLLKKPIQLYLSPFRAINSSIIQDLLRYRGPYVYLDGLILMITNKISSVTVKHHPRFADKSNYGFRKSFSLWLKMATNFSLAPLRLTSFAGFLISLLGFTLAIYFIYKKLTIGILVSGWTSLIVTILIIGGLQMLAIGMIGEYLGRVLLTLNNKPQFIIEEKIGF
jgi:undecaprenyl-phosphate 4-deoxy-4-formamido-L-arabinose transferase